MAQVRAVHEPRRTCRTNFHARVPKPTARTLGTAQSGGQYHLQPGDAGAGDIRTVRLHHAAPGGDPVPDHPRPTVQVSPNSAEPAATGGYCDGLHHRHARDLPADLNSGPGRIRTYDQGIHYASAFPLRVDYLFTRDTTRSARCACGCGTLVPVIKGATALR